MNERMKILKLLEEGKITAEEAARLLEAVAESEPKRRRGFFKHGMEAFSDVMSDMIGMVFSTPFKDIAEREAKEYSGKKKIIFRGISGDIEISGTDNPSVIIKKDGYARIFEEDDTLVIKGISGNLQMETPKTVDVEIKGVTGDLSLENISGRVIVNSVAGDITGKAMKGYFEGEFVSGDVELEYDAIDGIKIKSHSGDVILRIDENIEAEVEVTSYHGDINCDLPLKEIIERDRYLKGILNAPKSRIEVVNRYGDVILEKKAR